MKTLKNLFILGTITFTLLGFTKADILPENSHSFKRCIQIENPDEIDGFKLIIRINTVVGDNKVYEVEKDTCLQQHYKFGSSTPYLIQQDISIGELNNITEKFGENQNKFESYLGNIFTRFDTVNPNGGYISNNSKKTYENITYKLTYDNNEYKLMMTKQDHDGEEDTYQQTTLMGYTTSLNTPNIEESEDPDKILENGYTKEFNDAYAFAYNNGITIMKNIEQANMNGKLNRIAMAKMLSQYAINILNRKPDTTKICNFTDVTDNLDKSYSYGVTLACQLGIMGVNMTNNKFRPNDYVPRSEFGTALSRLLFGTADGKDNYYSTHLKVLKDNGIINNTDPNLYEKRGYVMLMLMRSK